MVACFEPWTVAYVSICRLGIDDDDGIRCCGSWSGIFVGIGIGNGRIRIKRQHDGTLAFSFLLIVSLSTIIGTCTSNLFGYQ